MTGAELGRPIENLLAEDNSGDVRLPERPSRTASSVKGSPAAVRAYAQH